MRFNQILLTLFIFCVAVCLNLSIAYAQVVSSSSADVTLPQQIDYQLPYPGLLPDNPLYFLKEIRDNVTAFFLSKPLDKAEFDLLQSDKNVEASYLLVTQEQGKGDLAWATFTQGQDDFDQAIIQTTSAKKQGYSTQDISKRLYLSNQKHEQLLHALIQETNQQSSQTGKNELDRIGAFTKEIKALQQ